MRQTERQKIRENCKRKATEDMSERPSKVILKEIQNNDTGELIPQDLVSVRQAIYRVRRKTQPKLPTSKEETILTLNEYDLKSSNDENMIFLSNSDTNIVMLSTVSNLNFLCRPDVQLFCDGTFQYCAKHFFQLYTIHGFFNGYYIPCVYFLLPSKSKDCYVSMFQYLKSACQDHDLNLTPNSIHLDFEIATHEAAKQIWPNVCVKACQFHLSQAWYRKIQSLGLTKEYKDTESPVGQWLKLFFGLSFLNPEEVEECFVFDIFSEAPDCERAIEFADYVVNTYIDQSSKFPPILWANSDLEIKRTTNGCESFHNEFGNLFYNSHPNIFDFLDKIKSMQTKTYLKVRASRIQAPLPKRERDNLEKKLGIQLKYKNGELSRQEYVKRMAFKALPVPI